ncbi:MAG TPA: M20/M25/M40 family metallo-hydrolase [Candidatus Paceibacterota bacterium]
MQSIQTILQKLISFKTTADRPEEIKKGFEYIASLFDSGKFDAQTFEKNGKYSLLVSFKGKDVLRPKILLNGHFDVVPAENEDQFEMKVEGNKAYGRGTADMKGMAAVLIEVMLALSKQEKSPDVAVLLNGDEEIGGGNGAGYCVKELGLHPSFVLCADGSHEEPDIVIKHKGAVWVELTAQGKTAHGAYVWKGENAIDKLFLAVNKIKDWIGPVEPGAWKTTVNVAVVETSNKTPNKVPSDAKAVLDIRFTEEFAQTPDELVEKISSLVPEVTVLPIEKSPMLFREDFANGQNPFLREFKRVADEAWGKSIPLQYGHGSTDARYFSEAGIPAVIFGAVGGNWHAAGEWVDLTSLEKNKEILLKFLLK